MRRGSRSRRRHDIIDVILTHLGLATEAPPIAAARAPPQVPIWPGALDPLLGADAAAFDPT